MKLNIKRLKEFLKFRKWNQADLARESGLSEPLISLLMKGERTGNTDTVLRLQQVTGLPLDELFPPTKRTNGKVKK